MIRELPRGPYGAFLYANYFGDKSSYLPRFTMGQGAIFSIKCVKPLEASLVAPELVSETDPLMLEEMTALISALNLDVVSLDEMRRRLVQGDFKRRFVCFTFDGAYRSILDRVMPAFKARGMPFTVFVAADHLRRRTMPWWLSLEAILAGSGRIVLEIRGDRLDLRCLSVQEKKAGYAILFKKLAPLPAEERDALVERALKASAITPDEAYKAQMLSAGELKQLCQSTLVTIGVLAGGDARLGDASYDEALAGLKEDAGMVADICGVEVRHFAYASAGCENIPARIAGMIRELRFDTAAGNVEGALWPEHAHELHALPRIALDNDPATLVRALMLGAEPTPISCGDSTPIRRAG